MGVEAIQILNPKPEALLAVMECMPLEKKRAHSKPLDPKVFLGMSYLEKLQKKVKPHHTRTPAPKTITRYRMLRTST